MALKRNDFSQWYPVVELNHCTMFIEGLIILISFVVLYCTIQSLVNKIMNYPPGPTALPIVGNLYNLGTSPLVNLTKLSRKYGGIFQIFLGSQRAVVVSDIDTARDALLRNVTYFAGRPSVPSADIFSHDGQNIAFGNFSTAWKMQKKIALGALKLYNTGTEKLERVILREVQEVTEQFDLSKEEPFNPHDSISLGVLNVICALTLGSRYSATDPEFRKVVELNDTFSATLGLGNLVDIFPSLKHVPFDSGNIRRLKRAVKERDTILARKFKEQLETHEEGKIRGFTDALITVMKDAESNDQQLKSLISENHVLMSMADMFAAGSESLTSTLLWVILLLNNYPVVQAKLHKELDEVIGPKRLPSLKDKHNLPYLEATIAEALRLRPAAPLGVPHKALVDTTLNGYNIPKETTLILNLWAMHHDQKHWERPSEFDPDRFLDKNRNVLNLSKTSYLPFSAGKRVCLGEPLARVELFLFVAQLMHQFKIENPPGYPLPSLEGKIGMGLKPKPYKVCIKRRY